MTNACPLGWIAGIDWIWAHRWTLWELTKHPLFAVGLTAWVSIKWVPRIAADYQHRARISEWRFGLLQQAALLYYRMNRAAAEYRHALTAIRQIAPAPANAGRDRHAVLREATAPFESCLGEAAALSDLMEQFFDEPSAGKRWNRVAETYMEIWDQVKRGESVTDEEIKRSTGRALDEWQTLVKEAAEECKRHPWEGASKWAWRLFRVKAKPGKGGR